MRPGKRPLYHPLLLNQQKERHPHLSVILNIYALPNSAQFVFTKLTVLYGVQPVNYLNLP